MRSLVCIIGIHKWKSIEDFCRAEVYQCEHCARQKWVYY